MDYIHTTSKTEHIWKMAVVPLGLEDQESVFLFHPSLLCLLVALPPPVIYKFIIHNRFIICWIAYNRTWRSTEPLENVHYKTAQDMHSLTANPLLPFEPLVP